MIGVLCDAGRLVCPGDEEPVDGQGGEDHSHPDRRLNRLGDHRQDRDGRRQDDVHDREEEVHLKVRNQSFIIKNSTCIKLESNILHSNYNNLKFFFFWVRG